MWSYNNVHNPLTLRWSWLKGKPVPDPTESNVNSWWAQWRLKSPVFQLFDQLFVQAQIKGSIKAPRHWPLWRESTGGRWFPLTKGQWRGQCFHLMMSSCPRHCPLWGQIHRCPVDSPHKGPVTRKMLPFDYVNLADDDAGNLQPVFFKRLHLLHICISSFFLFNTSLTTI